MASKSKLLSATAALAVMAAGPAFATKAETNGVSEEVGELTLFQVGPGSIPLAGDTDEGDEGDEGNEGNDDDDDDDDDDEGDDDEG